MSANIVVPEVGESIVDARVAKWLKKEGDVVAAGDPLVELETDKIDLEVAAPQAGVLARIDHRDGADVKVGEELGMIDEAAQASDKGAPAPSATQAAPSKPTQAEAERTRATPAARKAAKQNEVDLAQVRGSGDAGRVMRRDVEQAVRQPAGNGRSAATPDAQASVPAPPQAKPAPPVSEDRRQGESTRTEERVRMSKRRATIARRLVEAQS